MAIYKITLLVNEDQTTKLKLNEAFIGQLKGVVKAITKQPINNPLGITLKVGDIIKYTYKGHQKYSRVTGEDGTLQLLGIFCPPEGRVVKVKSPGGKSWVPIKIVRAE